MTNKDLALSNLLRTLDNYSDSEDAIIDVLSMLPAYVLDAINEGITEKSLYIDKNDVA